MNRTDPQNQRQEPAVHNSLGLEALLRDLQGDRKYSILDLGRPLGINVEFWSRIQCRLYIEDFYRSFSARVASAPEDPKEAIFADLLEFGDATRFDVILAWDLLNYLDLNDVGCLIRRLSRYCRPGALLFALISSLPLIPAEPTVFRIVDGDRMIYETTTQETRVCPRHQPRDITRVAAPFDVAYSFLLRHGVQEYIYVLRHELKAPDLHGAG